MTSLTKLPEFVSFRRVTLRGALLLLPFLALQLLELFVLPIDFFTFRVWEAALSTPYLYPGAYYPNLHIKKVHEYGDHYREGDPNKIEAKPVEWFTDSFGWRNRPEIEKREKYNIVVLGDSNVVGSFLDQKDTITEVLGARGGKTAYSYSYGSSHISLFFSDARLLQKSPELIVVESKLGNWSQNRDYLHNFREMPDGTLDVIDRSVEFKNEFYDPTRNHHFEQMLSRLTKRPMLHWLKSSLAMDFNVPNRNSSEVYVGRSNESLVAADSTWRLSNWIVSGVVVNPIPGTRHPALAIRATGPTAYWHTERFISPRTDGKIVVRFDARNLVAPTRHRITIFEDGSSRTVGEIVAGRDWRTFEIPIATNPGSVLEFQIDQADTWQSLSVRDFQVAGGGPLPLVTQPTVAIPMSAWTTGGSACEERDAGGRDCVRWPVSRRKGFVQTPVLPPAGKSGLLITFEARTDKPSTAFSFLYLFEGAQYKQVAWYAFGPEWREYSLLLQPDSGSPTKVQFDFPESVDELGIRDFRVAPVDRLR